MRSVVVLPTYNEAENIGLFLRAVRDAAPTTDVLVVDDNSPDGTGAIAESVAAEIGGVTVLHRPGKAGLGSAYREGFAQVLDGRYDVVVSMDADFSHDPDQIPEFIEAIEERRRSGHRIALRTRGRDHGLAGATPAPVEVGQCLHPHHPGRERPRLHERLPGLSGNGAGGDRPHVDLGGGIRIPDRVGPTADDVGSGRGRAAHRVPRPVAWQVEDVGSDHRGVDVVGDARGGLRTGSDASGAVGERHRLTRVVRSVWSPVVVVLVPFVVAAVRVATRTWYPVLDMAMTEFRVRDVGGVDTPLIGLPGRIGTFPDQGSHPGPLGYYLLAPVYRLFGSSAIGLLVAAVVIAAVSAVACVLVIRRMGGMRLQWAVVVVLLVVVQTYGFDLVGQPWNPYLPLLPWLATLIAVWAVVVGDNGVLWVATLAGTLCAQTHLPYVGLAGSIVVGATLVVAWRWWHGERGSEDRARTGRSLAIGVGVGVVCWVPVALDQLFGIAEPLDDHRLLPRSSRSGDRQACRARTAPAAPGRHAVRRPLRHRAPTSSKWQPPRPSGR